jgi:hypothetical protein
MPYYKGYCIGFQGQTAMSTNIAEQLVVNDWPECLMLVQKEVTSLSLRQAIPDGPGDPLSPGAWRLG